MTRLPVAPSVSGAITLISIDRGTPVSQVTPFGQPAVAVAQNVVVECTSATGTPVQLDGSQSFDPDGDTIRYSWSSAVTLQGATSAVASGDFPLGTGQATLTVTDGTPTFDNVTIDVTVEDTTPPVLQIDDVDVQTCVPASRPVTLTPPSVTSECQGAASVTFEASLVTVNGVSLPTPIAVDPTAPVIDLPPGNAVVEWVGSEPSGNAIPILQNVTVALNEESATCCSAGQTLVEGSGWPNWILRFDSQSYCVFGKGAGDTVVTQGGTDYLSGGPGSDSIETRGTGNVITGGPGDDELEMFFFGEGAIYGGDGDDVIHDSSGGVVFGGPGDDFIETDLFAHEIVPGPGRDAVYGGTGNDTVIIYDECELERFETLNGGLGQDTLVTPLSPTELFLRGVFTSGFETVIVTSSDQHLSECW